MSIRSLACSAISAPWSQVSERRSCSGKAVMRNGANPRTGAAIARGLGLGLDVKAGLPPSDKLHEIAVLKASGPEAAPMIDLLVIGIPAGQGLTMTPAPPISSASSRF